MKYAYSWHLFGSEVILMAGLLLLTTAMTPIFVQAQTVPAQSIMAPLLYADQMPTLPGGGGNAALVAALQKNFKYPKPTVAKPIESLIVVSIIVEADGSIRETKVVRSPHPSCDAAVLAAALRLPRFIPGRHNGLSVPVVVTVPLAVLLDQVAPASTTATVQPQH